MIKQNYKWNFELENHTKGVDERKSQIETMLKNYRKARDEAVSNKKKEHMELATNYIGTKTTMAFASSHLKGMGNQQVEKMY